MVNDYQSYEDIFAERGKSYHRAMEMLPQARAMEYRLAIDKAAPRDGDVLVDVPAAGGYLRRELRRPEVRYVAVEMAPDFADQCPTGPTDTVVRSPMERMDLPDGSADRLICLAASHHCEDKPAFFREVARVLKPGGRFVLLDGEAGTGVDRFLNGFINETNSMGHEGVFLHPGSAAEVAAAGFGLVSDEVITFPWAFPGRREMGVYCKLLFGIDLAGEQDVLRAIDGLLGYCDGPGAVNLAWTMRFIVADRQPLPR